MAVFFRRATFPEKMDIRQISVHLATRVIQQAVEEGLKVSYLLSREPCFTEIKTFFNFL
jgi:hypothetical protein